MSLSVALYLFFRYTPLMEASREGHLDMVALLLEHGKRESVSL